MHPTDTRQASAPTVASELVSLLHRLGFAVLARDPESSEVLAGSLGAESSVLAASPGSVRMATGRVGGQVLRLELVLPESQKPVELTPRQAEVGRLLVDGLRNQDIAERLRISEHTVRRHVEQLLRRLGVTNRAEAVDALKRGRTITRSRGRRRR